MCAIRNTYRYAGSVVHGTIPVAMPSLFGPVTEAISRASYPYTASAGLRGRRSFRTVKLDEPVALDRDILPADSVRLDRRMQVPCIARISAMTERPGRLTALGRGLQDCSAGGVVALPAAARSSSSWTITALPRECRGRAGRDRVGGTRGVRTSV